MTHEQELEQLNNTCYLTIGGSLYEAIRLANHFAAECHRKDLELEAQRIKHEGLFSARQRIEQLTAECKRLKTEIDFLDSKLASRTPDYSFLEDEGLVEAIARAICQSNGFIADATLHTTVLSWEAYIDDAKAALSAIKDFAKTRLKNVD